MDGVDNEDTAISCRIFTREGCRGIIRDGFEYAKKFGYKTVTIGEIDMAKKLEQAVADVIAEGKVRTYDMGGSATTTDMAEAIAARC